MTEISNDEQLEMESLRMPWLDTVSFDILLTRECNFRCRHCLQDRFTGTLCQELFFLAVEQIRAFKDQALTLSGGEPLSHPEIDSIFRYLIDINMPFSFVTNGSLLNKSTIDLLSNAPVSISMSLDGPESIHNSQRRHPSAFQKLDRALDLCLSRQIEVLIIASICKSNVEYLDWLATYCLEKGITSLRIQPIHAEGQAMHLYQKGELLDQFDLNRMYRKIVDLSGEFIGRLTISCLGSFKSDVVAHGCRLGIKFGSSCHNRSVPWPLSIGIDCEGNLLPLVPYLPVQWSIGNIKDTKIRVALLEYYRSREHIILLNLLRKMYFEIIHTDSSDYFDLGLAMIEQMKMRDYSI